MKKNTLSIIILAIMICFACNVSAQGFLDGMLNSSKESITQTMNDFKTWNGGRAVKIKLTGTLEENVVMTVGETGRKETISSLPYEFKVTKKDLPLKLSFTTKKGGKYATINVPKKATDNIGHVYLLKPDQQYFYANNGIPQQQVQQPVVVPEKEVAQTNDAPEFELKGINLAPKTNVKNQNTFAIIIANENYEMATKVDMATNDGLAMKEYFHKTFGLSENQVLYYPDATYGKINKAVKDMKNIADAFEGNINLIFYYAGHGIPDNATKDAYLMPVDADGSDVSVCYSLKKLYKEIDDMKLKQAVVFLDACFSGAKRDGDMVIAARGVAIKPKEEKPSGSTIVFSAASDEETAFAYEEKKHGLFTYHILDIFQKRKNKVTIGELADYITKNVAKQSILINGKKQTPNVLVPQQMGSNWRNLKLAF